MRYLDRLRPGRSLLRRWWQTYRHLTFVFRAAADGSSGDAGDRGAWVFDVRRRVAAFDEPGRSRTGGDHDDRPFWKCGSGSALYGTDGGHAPGASGDVSAGRGRNGGISHPASTATRRCTDYQHDGSPDGRRKNDARPARRGLGGSTRGSRDGGEAGAREVAGRNGRSAGGPIRGRGVKRGASGACVHLPAGVSAVYLPNQSTISVRGRSGGNKRRTARASGEGFYAASGGGDPHIRCNGGIFTIFGRWER